MQSNDKNETTRFLGDGVSFKAKLIGILEVSEARGDRMCQEALADLKMAIRAAGEHKQRIIINVAIDGLRLRDEKTGDSLYHHPVHKISFIAQDMTDSRAFGYIFGSPDTGHRFFGIKTDKAASQVVIAMRDLFQVVFALKKKEIEIAKQNLEKSCYIASSLLSDGSSSSSKMQNVPHVSIKSSSESKHCSSSTNEAKGSGTAVADLVDLELELNSLQQGLNQMERITPSDPFGSKEDPFGDSFTSYPAKPILPPPPPSNRERSSRTSESSSIFSPKPSHKSSTSTIEPSSIREFTFSHEFESSHEEPSSGDWFAPSAGNSIFEEPSPLPVTEPTKDEKHEQTKQEILSQFDVFTELDPLELKNPPKKALKELASTATVQETPLFPATFPSTQPTSGASDPSTTSGVFTVDPFGEDPFVKEDPFADSDFSKQDPFESEFASFKLDSIGKKDNSIQNTLPKDPVATYQKSPLEKQTSLFSTSPKGPSVFSRQATLEDKNYSKLTQLHDNPSLDISSESECAPEPPPRPFVQIKPPPLPPKKQTELATKPPPRPPHGEESPYDFIEKYETAPSSLEFVKNPEKRPPLPVPARKAKFESDFIPERPKKQFNVSSSEEDYLTPISFPDKTARISPPPSQKDAKKADGENKEEDSLKGLDITLSQLTLSGLNELAQKLNIPAGQLSNMTLVQLTALLSDYIKTGSTGTSDIKSNDTTTNDDKFPAFEANFAANFSNGGGSTINSSFDRYAVFRELMQEEIKQTKIDSEPEEISENKEKIETVSATISLEMKSLQQQESMTDRYAALREIVDIELKQSGLGENKLDDTNVPEQDVAIQNVVNQDTNKESEINIINTKKTIVSDEKAKAIISPVKSNIIEYSAPLDSNEKSVTIEKSPVKSSILKSPLPSAVSEIVQNSARMTSGSLSDVVSGSSPEVDNTASNSDAGKKASETTGESWAIFDQPALPTTILPDKDKQSLTSQTHQLQQTTQSEEGASPWSSDSKEFGDGSPTEWGEKESGGSEGRWSVEGRRGKSRGRGDQEGWWDTSAEPEVHQYPTRRSTTDSYDDDYPPPRTPYDQRAPRKRTRQPPPWQEGAAGQGGGMGDTRGGGGHSSSSRDVSPWEEEPARRYRQHSAGTTGGRGVYQRSRGGRGSRDSWDDDDDYEYDEEPTAVRCHWSDRHGPRSTDRESRHSGGSRDHDDWSDDRRHRRRRGDTRERWCCPDWEQEKSRYAGRWAEQSKWHRDERYYGQESPWDEDEYSNDPDESPHYLSAKKNWKQRPSSATEVERKIAEGAKGRHYMGTGSSDGERDRRYKPTRRSRSRDSQYSEPSHRYKPEIGSLSRSLHRKPHGHQKTTPDDEFVKKTDQKDTNKKSLMLARKKPKDTASKLDESPTCGTFPRKSSSRSKSLFENDFVSPEPARMQPKFNFDDFETSEAESPTTLTRPSKPTLRTHFEKSGGAEREFKEHRGGILTKEEKLSPRYREVKNESFFEDDFSPNEKSEPVPEDSISSIKEEVDR
ncbi:unnamed protein product [Acanthoscelides obtectus]|uniref:PID domain-containing protein n=1 Tax=Acanthoscelides obtectus TaxID=200917 RepID=A0A9P0JJL9_ACAOB|nr:unnamed protein product [Acanthoscelides obtectus]CAK1678649.1 Protein disabled [Acanthoscelides obtectus]